MSRASLGKTTSHLRPSGGRLGSGDEADAIVSERSKVGERLPEPRTRVARDGGDVQTVDGPVERKALTDQCYNNQAISGMSTPVTVTPSVTGTISAALIRGTTVSGTVTDSGRSMNGLVHVSVEVSSTSTGAHAWGATAADGSYAVKGLLVGTDYQVCFHGSVATGGSSDATGYVDQCWQDQATSGTPTPITLTSGATTTGVNAALFGVG